jgi:heme/copper-type cytochrome/quinol oxidase subunit 4
MENKMDDQAELRDDLTAMLAASRELSPENDTVLAEAILNRVNGQVQSAHRRHVDKPSSSRIVSIVSPLTFLALAASLLVSAGMAWATGASLRDFFIVWFFVLCVVSAIVQVAAFLALRQQRLRASTGR